MMSVGISTWYVVERGQENKEAVGSNVSIILNLFLMWFWNIRLFLHRLTAILSFFASLCKTRQLIIKKCLCSQWMTA